MNTPDAKQALQRLDELQPANTAVALLEVISRAAKDSSVDVEKMERLMAMHERVLAKQAESAFNVAMEEAQREMPIVKNDSQNSQTNSRYAKLKTLARLAVPIFTKHGFSLSFGTADCPTPDCVRVTCKVSHHLGHSEHRQCDVPLDILGAKGNPNKTRTHGFGSSLSYGRRYLTLLIFNIATSDDDDGQAAGGSAEGPEVLIGLKKMLWDLLVKHERVQRGGTMDHVRQYLTDEALIDQDVTMKELTAADYRRILATATKKLEAQ